MSTAKQAETPDFRKMLLTRHAPTDTICISGYKKQNGKFVVSERFCNGVDEAANLIERSYKREDIGALWSNLQRLKPGSHRRKKGETIDAYTNLLVDIDRKVKKDADSNKVNANDEERAVLKDVADKVSKFLAPAFGHCSYADSGNGYHLNWKLADIEPVEGQRLYRAVLQILKVKFERADVNVEIDASLADDTQVVTAWGSWNRKYAELLDRPCRQSKLLFVPSNQRPLTTTDLLLFVEEHPVKGTDTPKPGTLVPAKAKKNEVSKANPEWLEEYGVPDLIDFWEDIGIAYEEQPYETNGETHHPIIPCPCHSDVDLRPHSHARDCEIIEFAGGSIGISCFSGDVTNLKLVIKKLNELKGEKYPHAVFAEESDEAVAKAFGVVEDAGNISSRSTDEAVPTPIGLVVPEHEKPKELFEKPRLELWNMPDDCMYGWLGEQARTLGAPLSLAYPTMLCVFAGQGLGRSGSIRGNLYGCLIGAIGTGKTRTIDRALVKVEYEYPRIIKKRYPGSEHGLMITLDGKKPKDMVDLDYHMFKPFLLVQDELRNTFAKAGIDNSALPFAINHLFNQSEYETASKQGAMICIAHLSMIGGLTAENPEQFAEVFGKSTTTGLYDRFIYGVAPPAHDWDDEWEKTVVPVKRAPKLVNIPPEIYVMKKQWQEQDPAVRRRLGEIALRVALVSASANEDNRITEECMAAALRFCEWQQQIRAWYKPSDMDDKDGLCQEAIERALPRYADTDGWTKWKKAKDNGNLYRHTAPRLNRVFKSMIEAGMLEEEKDSTDDEGNSNGGKKVKTGRVRLVKKVMSEG